jgi:hypothetical protein
VSSEPHSGPINRRPEQYEAKKGDDRLLVACGDATIVFDAVGEAIDRMTESMAAAVETVVDVAGAERRDAPHGSGADQVRAELGKTYAFADNFPLSSQIRSECRIRVRMVLLTTRQRELDSMADGVCHHAEVGIEAAFGSTQGRGGLPACQKGDVLLIFHEGMDAPFPSENACPLNTETSIMRPQGAFHAANSVRSKLPLSAQSRFPFCAENSRPSSLTREIIHTQRSILSIPSTL